MSYTVILLVDNYDQTIHEETVPTWTCVRCLLSETDVLAYQVYDLSQERPSLYDIDGHEYDLVKIDQYLENKFLEKYN